MKIKRCLPIILLISSFVISGCNNTQPASTSIPDSSTPKIDYLKKDVTVKMNSLYDSGKKPYNISLRYDDEYFLGNAKTYDKDLSMLSFGASIATAQKERGVTFFYETDFEDIVPFGYQTEPTANTIGYFIAHKEIADFELVTVAFRGFEYGSEWVNNLTVGKTGDHEGFSLRANEAYKSLQSYLATYTGNKPLKLWINGYSRAGAISHVLTSLILKENKINVSQDNMFVYTFEAPASLSEENALPYENVHNIINNADIVTFVPPTKYGLNRCGVDYPIYDANVSALLKEFDDTISMPDFVTAEDSEGNVLNNDLEVREYLLNTVFNKKEIEGEDAPKDIYANTREQYVDNYQTGLSLSVGLLFNLKDSTLNEMVTDLQNLGFGAISIIGDSSGKELATFLKKYLDQDGVNYVEDQLEGICAILVKGIQNILLVIVLMYLSEYKGDLVRLINMHYPETTYTLLLNAHKK